MTQPFGSLYSEKSKNGLTAPSRVRGSGTALVNMREIFAFSRISGQPMELAPLPEKDREQWLIQPGDLLFARQSLKLEGAGKCVLVEPAPFERTFESHLIRVRLNRKIADPGFFYYYFTSSVGKANVGTIVEQVAAAGIRSSDLALLEVPVPPLRVQHGIAATLGVLDRKIDSNRRLMGLIPQAIRSLVDSASVGASESIPVASLGRFVNGGAYTKGATGNGRMVLRIAELNSGPGGSTVYNDIDVPDDKTARAGDILMSWSGSLGVYRWFRDEAIINQHIFKVIPTGYPDWLVFDRLEATMHVFRGLAADKATTMGHIQRGHLESTEVDVPEAATIAALDEQVAPLWNRLLVAEREVVRLTTLRDALFPGLLSGRIRVPAEEVTA